MLEDFPAGLRGRIYTTACGVKPMDAAAGHFQLTYPWIYLLALGQFLSRMCPPLISATPDISLSARIV